MSNTVKNVRKFVSFYLDGAAGKAALNRKPVRIKKERGWESVWKNPAMAVAFQKAIQ